MSIRNKPTLSVFLFLVIGLTLAACSTDSSQESESESPEASTSTMAMVDSVTIEEQAAHPYAVVNGNYPDACSRISDVTQEVDGNTINITLYTDRPPGFACASMLSPFSVNILLEAGGLVPGDYTVNVNGAASATYTLGS